MAKPARYLSFPFVAIGMRNVKAKMDCGAGKCDFNTAAGSNLGSISLFDNPHFSAVPEGTWV
jgi:hypothetical protein